jgi:hypothetical protein
MPANPPSTVEFIRAFRKHWLAAMSGSFSVPFTAAAFFVDGSYGKLLFALLAVSAMWFAAYTVWHAERQKLIVAERREEQAQDELRDKREALALQKEQNEIQRAQLRAIESDTLPTPAVQAYVDKAIDSLSSAALEALRMMSDLGRPQNVNSEIWSELQRAELVERDFTGPKGIKPELQAAVRIRLREIANMARSSSFGAI